MGGASSQLITRWLEEFEAALAGNNLSDLAKLFHEDCHWRDLLAVTWKLESVSGRDAVTSALQNANAEIKNLRIAPGRTPPRWVQRAGEKTLEAIFVFESAFGAGAGVLRLKPDPKTAGESSNQLDQDKPLLAWTLMTALEELDGHAEPLFSNRPKGEAYSRDFRGPNWLDLRQESRRYADRDPAVLIVGGGQAGLSIAARLNQLKIDCLIVDRHQRIGDNWRKRYHALTLHNQVQVNHLPYMHFPPNWPTYIPKDKLANWFEAYVEAMEINYWTGTTLKKGDYDEDAACWEVTLEQSDGDGAIKETKLRPRHVIMASGVSGLPNIPNIPTLDRYQGKIVHSGAYTDGDDWRRKKTLVIGTGNSGHDIAQDLYSSDAEVTIVQRSPTMIIELEPSAQLPYALYEEGPPLEDCDLVTIGTPLALAKRSHQIFTKRSAELDSALLTALERIGFKLDYGEDNTGWQFKYLTRGGGYYFNVGCSNLLAEEKIRLLAFDQIAEFTTEGARLKDGGHLAFDLLVLATGYQPQENLVRQLFGAEVAERVGPIWGFGETQELRNMYCRTGQPGLWFIAGSLAQCRIFSKYMALQVKACEEGLISTKL